MSAILRLGAFTTTRGAPSHLVCSARLLWRSDDLAARSRPAADDYLTKPFSMEQLLARVIAVLRRQPPDDIDIVLAVDLAINLAEHRIERAGVGVRLKPKEWSVLAVLPRHPESLVTQGELLQTVWVPEYGSESDYLS